ncbi:unnamed protein product [Arabis nemorensis]|uniref:Uncharacterized protein n=1 Tax=Arabis nemorensis TaxID=586526 RepID=A0A565AZA5_9BRAS|nr:unnamed protein product [Arabis nemorensis]
MTMARASASASLLDGKIYVFGGCVEYADSSNWAEVFDLKTQTWGHWYIPKMRYDIHQSVVVEEEKTVYAVDVERRTLRLCANNSAGNIVIFWNAHREDPEALELSMEKRQGGEIWAKIEWSRPLYKLDLHSHPNQHGGLKVLYSASVLV